MKLKYFIRGLGAGIVFAAFILAIVLRSSEKEQLSDEEIKSRAIQMGMVEPDDVKLKEKIENKEEDTPDLAPKDEIKDMVQETTKDVAQKDKEDEIKSSDKSEEKENADQEPNNSKPEKNDVAEKNDVVKEIKKDTSKNEKEPVNNTKKISFTIKKGMFSNHVANELQRLGLIKDSKEFDRYLIKNGYQSKIMIGNYEINSDATFDQIARIIIK